jgi:hypothetical protein
MCSSDRKRFIVLQVKTMSSHQREAATRQWKSRRSSSGRCPRTAIESGSPESGQGLDLPVDVQGGADPERVPGAVGIPPAAGGVDAVGGRDAGERIRHPDLVRRRVEHERVLVVQAAPAGDDLGGLAAGRGGDLGCRRHATELHHLRVRQLAKLEIACIHARFLRSRASIKSPSAVVDLGNNPPSRG